MNTRQKILHGKSISYIHAYLINGVSSSKQCLDVVERLLIDAIVTCFVVLRTKGEIDLDVDVHLITVSVRCLEIAMALPESKVRAAEIFLDSGEVDFIMAMVVMAVMTMMVMMIMMVIMVLEEIARKNALFFVRDGCVFLTLANTAGPRRRFEWLSLDGPSLKWREGQN